MHDNWMNPCMIIQEQMFALLHSLANMSGKGEAKLKYHGLGKGQ
jgi:hypothetical protein